jgi:NitT/TauT family transport system ATP-binding protein
MLALNGIVKRFNGRAGRVEALGPLDLSVKPGEFVCLVGPSGCGKTTLLNLVAGFEQPDAGTITLDGAPAGPPGPDRGVLFQDGALFPWLTARGNVEFPLARLGLAAGARRDKSEALLKMVHLGDFADAHLHELSGGMRQRVALARALAGGPRVLLMDEPFGALDAMTREHLYAELQEIHAATRPTILFITHNVREAACLGDRLVLLSHRPGRILAELSVDLPRPRTMNQPEIAALGARAADILRAAAADAEVPS